MIQPRTLRQPDGRLKLARLPAAIPDLRVSSAALFSARNRLRATPSSGVVSAITNAQQTLARSLNGLAGSLDIAYRAARIGPEMLGANDPRCYLVIPPDTGRGTRHRRIGRLVRRGSLGPRQAHHGAQRQRRRLRERALPRRRPRSLFTLGTRKSTLPKAGVMQTSRRTSLGPLKSGPSCGNARAANAWTA